MKSILISIKPKWVAKILKGEKTIEIRTTAPKCALPIDVYIYCTKTIKPISDYDWGEFTFDDLPKLGKVVAKFTLNKIENFINGMNELEREWDGKPDAEYDYFAYEKALEKACLTYEEADEYCPDQSFYAWHISDLEIFDRPRGLCEFHTNVKKEPPEELLCPECGEPMEYYEYKYLTKAPRSWQFIEEEE